MKEFKQLLTTHVDATPFGPNNTIRICGATSLENPALVGQIVSNLINGSGDSNGILALVVLNASSDILARVASVLVDEMIDLRSALKPSSIPPDFHIKLSNCTHDTANFLVASSSMPFNITIVISDTIHAPSATFLLSTSHNAPVLKARATLVSFVHGKATWSLHVDSIDVDVVGSLAQGFLEGSHLDPLVLSVPTDFLSPSSYSLLFLSNMDLDPHRLFFSTCLPHFYRSIITLLPEVTTVLGRVVFIKDATRSPHPHLDHFGFEPERELSIYPNLR